MIVGAQQKTVNYAAVMGLYEETGITVSQLSTLALIFFVLFLILEFPHAYKMQRLPTAEYLAAMVIWGLGASVWTKDFEEGDRFARQLEAGSVWINTHFEQDPFAPSGSTSRVASG